MDRLLQMRHGINEPALSPLDGRYHAKVESLSHHFSEFGLIRNRVRVEIAWLKALADEALLPEVPAFSASLAYFDSYRSARLPSNLLQAQRDFFGAHTYERVDKPGIFHTEWMESDHKPVEKTAAPKRHEPHQAGE